MIEREVIPQVSIPKGIVIPGMDALDEDLVLFDESCTLPEPDSPVRLNASLLVVCLNGQSNLSINLQEYTLQKGDMLVLLPDQIIQKVRSDSNGRFIMVGLSREFVNSFAMNVENHLNVFFHIQNSPVTRLSESEIALFKDYHVFIRKRLRDENLSYRKDLSRHLLYSWFYEILTVMDRYHPNEHKHKTRRDELFEHFLRLVSANYKQERFVGFYAGKLCVTPKYLSQIVQQVSGISANEWINRKVITEAQALLKNSTMTVQEISDFLGFPNQSFFGRYFKKHIGLSPREFRG